MLHASLHQQIFIFGSKKNCSHANSHNKTYFIITEIYGRKGQQIKAIRYSSPLLIGRTNDRSCSAWLTLLITQTFLRQNFAAETEYQWNKQITLWKMLCTILINPLSRIRKLNALRNFYLHETGTKRTIWPSTTVPWRVETYGLGFFFIPFTPDSAMSKIDKFSKITNWVKLINKQHHSKVLLNSFPMNGETLGFCP